jgi:hypothetical protein
MYRRAQNEFLGRHNRPISERRLELFRYVNARTSDPERKTAPWRALMEEWNHAHLEWSYGDVRNFARDYWNAFRLILFPKYAMRDRYGKQVMIS